MASFIWITEQEKKDNTNTIWLIEEPESYLHPNLCENVNKILKDLSKISKVVITTHSLGFVPHSPKEILGTQIESGQTKLTKFKLYSEATEKIRESLGVKMSDFLNLAPYNLFVEGPTDKEYIEKVLDILDKKEVSSEIRKILDKRDQILIYELGGVTQLSGFLKANWQFIVNERKSITILDGDEAGDKVRRELQGYFGKKKIRFEYNKDYISLTNGQAIEYMFPDEWIKELNQEQSSWYKTFSLDFQENLQPFSIHDNKKKQYMTYMLEKAKLEENLEWASKWESLLNIIAKNFEL